MVKSLALISRGASWVTRCCRCAPFFIISLGPWHMAWTGANCEILSKSPNSPWTWSPLTHLPWPILQWCPTTSWSNDPQVSRECADVPCHCATHLTTRGLYKTCGCPSNQQATVVQMTQEGPWWWWLPWWWWQQQQWLQWGQQQQQQQQPTWGPLWRSHFEGMFQFSYSIVYWLVFAAPSLHEPEDHELSLGPNVAQVLWVSLYSPTSPVVTEYQLSAAHGSGSFTAASPLLLANCCLPTATFPWLIPLWPNDPLSLVISLILPCSCCTWFSSFLGCSLTTAPLPLLPPCLIHYDQMFYSLYHVPCSLLLSISLITLDSVHFLDDRTCCML